MNPRVNVILTNAQGWQKPISLDEGIYWIGTAPECAIRLPEGDPIAPYHLQIVNDTREAHVRLVNLSSLSMIVKNSAHDEMLDPRSMKDLFGGETIHLGTYRLQFEIHKEYVPRTVAREQNQQVLGLRLVLSGHVLQPAKMISGRLYLRNLGSLPCQFEVRLEGLPVNDYEIDPPPLINPGGEESSDIRIYHHLISPPAGSAAVTLRVSAPSVYPGLDMEIRQTIKVLPSYQFLEAWEGDPPPPDPLDTIEFTPPEAWLVEETVTIPQPPLETAPDLPAGGDTPQVASDEEEHPRAGDQAANGTPIAAFNKAKKNRVDLSNARVVHGSSGDFLDDKEKRS